MVWEVTLNRANCYSQRSLDTLPLSASCSVPLLGSLTKESRKGLQEMKLPSLLCVGIFVSAEERHKELPLTPTHLTGQLVIEQQLGHVCVGVLAQDGIHSLPILIQPEVEVTKPENFIKPSCDITCKFTQVFKGYCWMSLRNRSFLSTPWRCDIEYVFCLWSPLNVVINNPEQNVKNHRKSWKETKLSTGPNTRGNTKSSCYTADKEYIQFPNKRI